MSAVLIVIIILLAGSTGFLLARELKRRRTEAKITPAATRILFPFVGDTLSTPAFDAALRIARAEGATLVPAYLAIVPLSVQLDTPLKKQAEVALPMLEAIEQRAATQGVPGRLPDRARPQRAARVPPAHGARALRPSRRGGRDERRRLQLRRRRLAAGERPRDRPDNPAGSTVPQADPPGAHEPKRLGPHAGRGPQDLSLYAVARETKEGMTLILEVLLRMPEDPEHEVAV